MPGREGGEIRGLCGLIRDRLRMVSKKESAGFQIEQVSTSAFAMARTLQKPTRSRRPGRPTKREMALKAARMAPRQELEELQPSDTEVESIFPEGEVS
jgi:hypothetical protein